MIELETIPGSKSNCFSIPILGDECESILGKSL